MPGLGGALMAATQQRVVVGVDGSGGSYAALSTALREARKRAAVLEVVYVWALPIGKVFIEGGYAAAAADAAARLDGFLAELPLDPRVEVVRSCVEGRFPSTVLVEASKEADLLVVGRRGHNRFSELLGSTSRACIEHSFCPVLVVPEAHGRDGSAQRSA